MTHPKILFASATFASIALVATLVFGIVAPATVEATECGPCQGPTRTAQASKSGATSSQAYNAAYNAAINKAFADAPACSPCQINESVHYSYIISDCIGPAPCPPPQWIAHVTLSYKCEACSPGGPE